MHPIAVGTHLTGDIALLIEYTLLQTELPPRATPVSVY
jgi:hypothetical protein